MSKDAFDQLEALIPRGFCWVVGRDRHFPERVFCRVYPKKQLHGPVVTKYAKTVDAAVNAALNWLGDQKPERTPGA